MFNSLRKTIIVGVIAFLFLLSVTAHATLQKSGKWLTYNKVPIYLIGYDLQQFFADATYSEDQIKTMIDAIALYGATGFRVWINNWWIPPGKGSGQAYYPYKYSGGKFDLTSFNEDFFTRYKSLIAYAKAKGLIVKVVVFSEYPEVIRGQNYWNNNGVVNYWRSAQNSNGFWADVDGDLYPEFFIVDYTSGGANLTTYQKALASKVIDELGSIGNVFFQIHNEFPTKGGTDFSTGASIDSVYPWQQYMADYFHNTKRAITSVHAHEYWGMQTEGVEHFYDYPSVDILNFHPYSSAKNDNINDIGTLYSSLQNKDKVLMIAESHRFSKNVDTVTREMWASFTNGIYYFAYGNTFDIGSSAWITRAKRVQTLKNISALGNWWDATRNPSLVTAGPGDYWQGIANDGRFYVYYFTGAKSTRAASMNLPEGTYNYTWYDTRAWNSSGLKSGQVSGASPTSIPAPTTAGWNDASGVVLVIKESRNLAPLGNYRFLQNIGWFKWTISLAILLLFAGAILFLLKKMHKQR